MIASFIQWDTDGDKRLFKKLPDVVELPADEFSLDRYLKDPDEVVDEISDWLTDTYGFCHTGFKIGVYEDEMDAAIDSASEQK